MFQTVLKGVLVEILIVFIISCEQLHAQAPMILSGEQGAILSHIEAYMKDYSNPDSTFYYIQKFSDGINQDTEPILTQIIHYGLAGQLIGATVSVDSMESTELNRKGEFATVILDRLSLSDTGFLAQTVRPLSTWIQIQNANEPSLAAALTKKFIEQDIIHSDLYRSRAGRYGVMIFKYLAKSPDLAPLAIELFTVLSQKLAASQMNSNELTPFIELQKRSWLRYMYASLNLLRAEITTDPKEQDAYLKNAFQSSPDRADLQSFGYYNDMSFLFGTEKVSFQEDYLEFLTQQKAESSRLIPVLLQMSLVNPIYRKQLQGVYNQMGGSKIDFESYWIDNVNSQAAKFPLVELSMLDNNRFISDELRGKWILVDFWGTWCAPCRAEHPDLEKLYKSYILPKHDQMAVLTIACNDTKQKVADYMKEKSLSFPVALSDGRVEKYLAITFYPTKLLITPQGNYIRVPNGKNWVEFVKLYTDL